MAAPARHAGRQFRRRYPDMFADDRGVVHPIRASPGYDVLEDRAAAVSAHRARQEEEAHEEERQEARPREDAIREWKAIRAALPRGVGRSRQGGSAASRLKGSKIKYTYDREDIPSQLYRPDGIGVDQVGERLVPVVGDQAEHWDSDTTLRYLQAAHRRYEAQVAGHGGHDRARAAGRALASRRRKVAA